MRSDDPHVLHLAHDATVQARRDMVPTITCALLASQSTHIHAVPVPLDGGYDHASRPLDLGSTFTSRFSMFINHLLLAWTNTWSTYPAILPLITVPVDCV
ncbi:hypothetical protein H1R20_g3128, partial [Candolleomyces eurysporus]